MSKVKFVLPKRIYWNGKQEVGACTDQDGNLLEDIDGERFDILWGEFVRRYNVHDRLVKALKGELLERTGTIHGACEVCGGDGGKVPYCSGCCKKPRRILRDEEVDHE